MEITDVRIRRVGAEGKMKAVVSVTFDDMFVVHDIKIIQGDRGFFIAMPSRKANDGDYRDIAHPISTQMREHIQDCILERYKTILPQEVAAEISEEEVYHSSIE